MNKVLLSLIGILLVACSDDSPTENSHDLLPSEDIPGFVNVKTSGASTVLGTKDSEASSSEQHQMKVNFTYDFFIGKHEVTCKEFIEAIDYDKLKDAAKAECNGEDFPIANVSYFDAVLFANARSKSESYDTAYTYTSASFDTEGHCISLEGFAFHPEAKAYRLPTEAEWTFVATKVWKSEKAWTSENSDFKVHEVCTKSTSGSKICDIKGNLLEWVNDWYTVFLDTTVTNFAGAPDGSSIGKRVVKGGSYRNSEKSIEIYQREDIYTVTSASRETYIGFRLAFGEIPDPTWINENGVNQSTPIVFLVNSTSMRKLTSSFVTRIVFRNDETGRLNYVDYSGANPTIMEIADSIDAYHPEISPDGENVAFCTVFEGLSQKKSSLYVYNFSSGSIVKLDAESAAIPRWNVSEDGDTSIVYVDDAGINKDSATFFSKTTWQVSFSNGSFGTPKKLFDGNYHGGVSPDLSLAVTGARLLRARISNSSKAKDTIWYNEEQACNASLSKDGTKRTLFLDFSGETGQKFIGKNYEEHEYIFIADSTGKLIQSIKAPANYTFDHTEWVNMGNGNSDFIIATLTNVNGLHQKIVLIDPKKETSSELISSNDLWHPTMWSKPRTHISGEESIDYDSAGIYYNEKSRFPSYHLRQKMEWFWVDRENYTAVGLGSSRMLFGINSREIKHEKFLNFAYAGGDFFGDAFLLENYVLNHMKKVKYLVFEFTPNMFWRTENMDWNSVHNNVPGYIYDEHHNFWKDNVPDDFIEAVIESPTTSPNMQDFPYRDEFTLQSKSWGKAISEANTSAMVLNDKLPQANMALFKDMVKKANDAGIKVIALVFPVHPGFGKTGIFGAFGPSNETAQEIFDEISKLDLILMDEYKWGEHDYTNEMASDPDHLSYLGAEQLSHRLDSLLQTLE